MTHRELMTAQQAADRLGVNVRTIHRWVSADRLTPAKKLPGHTGAYLFTPESLDALATEAVA